MKILFILFLIIISLFISGCGLKDYAYNFPSNNNANCILECKELMQINNCMTVTPSYNSIYHNNDILSGECSCFTGDCFKRKQRFLNEYK